MPTLSTLSIQHFRNLKKVFCELSPSFNLFYGENGAGKTSLLEAIYYLGLGKSFRSSQYARIIQSQQEKFTLIAALNDNNHTILGMERDRNGSRTLKLGGEKQNSLASIAKLLPIQFMSPMSYRFFHDGPKVRRQYLDWALFHVEPTYYSTWQQLQRLLKQRNSALKFKQSTAAWDYEFVIVAEAIDKLRHTIFTKLKPLCEQQLQQLLPGFEFLIQYQRGWPTHESLSELLRDQMPRDRALGYTYFGPQRADFQLFYSSVAVQDMLSQGQQKLAAYALHLALGRLLQQEHNVSPLYLIDDLPSELDANNRSKIIQSLCSLNAQTFITGISVHDLPCSAALEPAKLFHVEHGSLMQDKAARCA